MQINKSDRKDAVGIARIMQCGWYKEVRVKGLNSHAMRALLESRALLVKMKRDLETRIRGLLKNLGLILGRREVKCSMLVSKSLSKESLTSPLQSCRCSRHATGSSGRSLISTAKS